MHIFWNRTTHLNCIRPFLWLVVDFSMARMHKKAGTKVGPDQLGPPVRVRSTWIDSDQLGSNKKIKIK